MLLPERIREGIRREEQRLTRAEELTASHSPKRILQLGFAIVRSEGHAIKQTAELQQAQRLTIELADGETTLNLSPKTTTKS
jgi:exodeoxyribonuclease VII large subunit